MSEYSPAFRNAVLSTWRNEPLSIPNTYASLHSANPGITGANEISGGSPPYERKEITWNPPIDGEMLSLNAPVIDVPGGTTINWAGYWSASSGGMYLGCSIIQPRTYASQGTYTLTNVTADLNAISVA